jgi:4-amino-4-deoxy-L-arabinose transferase-like glycosyltransferase
MSGIARPAPARHIREEPAPLPSSGGRGRAFSTAFALLIAVALVLRLGFMLATSDYVPAHDDGHYARLACSIVVGGSYSLRTPSTSPEGCTPMPRGPNPPTAFRPPGYPLVLAAVLALDAPLHDDFWTNGRILNALLGTLAVALVGLIALEVWGRRIALVAMALAAVDTPLILVGGSLLSEPLFVVLVLAAVYVALRSRTARARMSYAAAAGVLVGLAALTRSTGLVLLVPLGVAFSTRPRRPAAAVVLLIAAAVTIAPWTIRNEERMHAFIPVSSQVGSWLAGTYNDQARNDPLHPAASQVRVHALRDLDRLGEADRQRALTHRAVDYAAHHPGYVGEVVLYNTLRMLNLQGAGWWRAQGASISMPRWASDAGAYGFYALALLALIGALTPDARRAPLWVWLVAIILFAAVVVAGSEIRYRAPVEPFIVLLAAVALTHRPRRAGSRRTLRFHGGGSAARRG